MNEIEALPERTAVCPVCHFTVVIPLVDTLMRRPSGYTGDLVWEKHAARVDSDLCPYPGPDKIAYQADIVICPSCGYAQESRLFEHTLSQEAMAWVYTNLRPSLRQAENQLLGQRFEEMHQDEVTEFFNNQAQIPDTLRTEHWRTYLAAMHAPLLIQARATQLTAWASRHQTAAPPQNTLFAHQAEQITVDLAGTKRSTPDLQGEIEALQKLLRQQRQIKKNALPGARDMTLRLMLAGLWDRLGFLDQAEDILQQLFHECRERFLRPDQDPLWPATSPQAAHTHRLNELEVMRLNAENEVLTRIEMVRHEKRQLQATAQCLRSAIRNGELDGKPEAVLFYAYTIGESLRRAGNLPLASEWFKVLGSQAQPDSPLFQAANKQLELVSQEAADTVNLLSALGQDGELFDRLRQICTGRH